MSDKWPATWHMQSTINTSSSQWSPRIFDVTQLLEAAINLLQSSIFDEGKMQASRTEAWSSE